MFRKWRLVFWRILQLFNKISKSILLLIVLFIVLSCEFQPSEIPETKIEPPGNEIPLLYIEVEPNMDTLKLATDVWAEFKLTSQEADVLWVRLYFDGDIVSDSEYNPQYLPRFYIALGEYTIGMHEFTIQAFASSNSGSIADKVGGEGYLYEANWPIYINHNVQQLLNVLDVEYKNGKTDVKWEPYDYYGFQFYELNKYSVIDGNSVSVKIENPKQNFYTDITCLEGEYISYSVALNGIHFSSYNFNTQIEEPVVEKTNDNLLHVSWRKTENPGMLGYYFATIKAPVGGKNEEAKIESPETTTTTFSEVGFGDVYEVQVRYVPKTFNGHYLNYNSAGGVTTFSLGNSMPAFSKGLKIGNTDEVLLFKSRKFYKYNVEDGAISDSIDVGILSDSINIKISESGKFFGYFANNEFVLRETSSLNVVNHFKIPSYSNNSFAARSMSVSDNYQLAVVDVWDALIVYDCITGNEVFREAGKTDEIFFGAEFNAEGTKMLLLVYSNSSFDKKLELADFDGKKLQKIGEIVTDNYDYKARFHFAGNDIVILKNTYSYNYTGEIRSASDFSLLNELKFPEGFVPVALDVTNKQAVLKYGYSGAYAYSYSVDLNSGLFQKIVPIVGDVRFIMSGFLLCNGILMNGTGRFLSINDLSIHE